ncbi:hypothetical protein J3R83DRAFT_9237 [Lanmaoa asiatica]|nr:hypothetical protein J3R83DRAFT_9237 [Lanmaoa asiatica]
MLPNRYLNSLLNIFWTPEGGTTTPTPASPITLEKNEMQNAMAQTAAAFIWLAGEVGVYNGGFPQDQGDRSVSYEILEFRLNVNTIPVAVGLFASFILLATVVWMFHHPQPPHVKASITSPNILGLIYISVHSISLQDFMKLGIPLLDHLRLKGMKAEVCLAGMNSEPIRLLASTNHNLQVDAKAYSPHGHILEGEGSSQLIPI